MPSYNGKIANEEFKELVNSLNSGPPDDVLSTHKLNMRRRDYKTLTGKNYLNDKIIDEYMTLIKERHKREGLANIYNFPSYVYPHLKNDTSHYEYLEKQIKVDLTSVDIFLIPIHYEDHWSLVSVDVKERKILYYYLNLGFQNRSSGPRTIKNFSEWYFNRKRTKETFTFQIVKDAPL